MYNWINLIQISFHVSDHCFRNYIPFGWDAETSTCSLLINVAEDKIADQWAKMLQTGDQVHYNDIYACSEKLHPGNLIVGMGDSSSMSFLLALQQLISPAYRFDGAIYLDCPQTIRLFSEYFDTPLTVVKSQQDLINWLISQQYCWDHTGFFLSGNVCLTAEIQKLLRNLGHRNIQIFLETGQLIHQNLKS